MNLESLKLEIVGIEEIGTFGKVISSDLVKKVTGLGRTALDSRDKEGVLRKIYLAPRKHVYLLDEVNAYLDNCITNPTMYKEDEENIKQARQAPGAKKAKQ